MSFNITSLFSLGYWFGNPPSFKTTTLLVYVLALGLLFLLGVVCMVIAGKQGLPGVRRGMFRRFGIWAFVCALLGAVLVFFRYEYIPFLSRRFWFGLWLAGMAVWAVYLARTARARLSRIHTAVEDPFLPKRKSV